MKSPRLTPSNKSLPLLDSSCPIHQPYLKGLTYLTGNSLTHALNTFSPTIKTLAPSKLSTSLFPLKTKKQKKSSAMQSLCAKVAKIKTWSSRNNSTSPSKTFKTSSTTSTTGSSKNLSQAGFQPLKTNFTWLQKKIIKTFQKVFLHLFKLNLLNNSSTKLPKNQERTIFHQLWTAGTQTYWIRLQRFQV